IDYYVYQFKPYPDLEIIPSPRIFYTHTPYPLLPSSFINSKSKIVYMCKNLLDQFVSFWHFKDRLKQQGSCTSISEALEMFYRYQFSEEEVNQGMIEEIAQFCSFEKMKNLEGNKSGKRTVAYPFENNAYFTKGVGVIGLII
ncbi:Sulfotransferase domain, partial [Dillenia turbinata]